MSLEEMEAVEAQYEDYYTAVSRGYDSYYEGYNTAAINTMSRLLEFSADDTVVDIGGGTGEIGHLLFKKFNLKKPVLCVDPSESMLALARQKKGVATLKATAEEFLSKYSELDKILIIGCYHHLKDPSEVFEGVFRALSTDGVCLILRMTSDSAPLMFTKAKEAYPPLGIDQIVRLVESKGLGASVTVDCVPCEIEKAQCFDFLRNRMFSFLSKFTDEEIEEGIREMAEKYKEREVIKAEYKFDAIIITKN